MNGTKHVAIISDAASTGELYHWKAFSRKDRLVWVIRRPINITLTIVDRVVR